MTGIFSFSLLLQMAAFFTMAAVIYTLDTDSTVLRNAISWTVFILPLTISLFTAVLTVRLYLRREGGCRYSDNDICLNALISCFIVTLIIWLGTVVPAAAADMEGWFVLSVFIFLPGVAALCGLAMGIMLVSTLLYMHKVK